MIAAGWAFFALAMVAVIVLTTRLHERDVRIEQLQAENANYRRWAETLIVLGQAFVVMRRASDRAS